jgi:squalene-associated FAD-dependent desaturase
VALLEDAPAALVIGGGVAGIAAALLLRDRGRQVTLLESRSQLGGRAFSLADEALGYEVDNGPHVLLGCYRRFRWLLRRLGSEERFARPRALAVHYQASGGRACSLRLSRLPCALAFPSALLRLESLRWSERLAALRGLWGVLRGAKDGESLEQWIGRRRQGGAPRQHLWDPLCRAMMNTEPGSASAALFLRTLRRAFAGSAAGAAMWCAAAPWSAIVDQPARAALAAAGVRLRLGARAVRLEVERGEAAALVLHDGERIGVGPRTLVVSALPWRALHQLCPQACPAAAELRGEPIVTVWFAGGPPLPLPVDAHLVILVGGPTFHFLVRRPGDRPDRYALLSGGAHGLEGLPVDAVIARAHEALAARFGLDLRGARARVTKEAQATLRIGPDVDARRPLPGPVPGIARFLLCGDWTQVGLPSTLEGAVESAFLAIERCGERVF